jgi:hypothetical protein
MVVVAVMVTELMASLAKGGLCLAEKVDPVQHSFK